MRSARVIAVLACAGVLAACSSDPDPVQQKVETAEVVAPEYDASLEPSAAVLSLVPDAATSLSVTDFDQLRLTLGFGTLTGQSPANELARFWRQVPRTAALSEGLLRGVDARLRTDFGVSQDDVVWEARYDGDVSGWVLAFGPKASMPAVQRAVRAGVGPLRGAVVDAARRLVTSVAVPEIGDSWAAQEELVALSGREAVSTYVERGCVPFDTVFGDGTEAQLADTPAAALRTLDDLTAYSVALGAELVTVRLGPDRSDAFERARLAEVMPQMEPEFGLVMSRPVADPGSGRLGYVLARPAEAARLVQDRQLPFAVC